MLLLLFITTFRYGSESPVHSMLLSDFKTSEGRKNYDLLDQQVILFRLGVVFDSKLNWSAQVAQAITKSKKTLHAI